MIAYGLGVLRLPPDGFWALTPRELSTLLAGTRTAVGAPARDDLGALMRAHPDEPR